MRDALSSAPAIGEARPTARVTAKPTQLRLHSLGAALLFALWLALAGGALSCKTTIVAPLDLSAVGDGNSGADGLDSDEPDAPPRLDDASSRDDNPPSDAVEVDGGLLDAASDAFADDAIGLDDLADLSGSDLDTSEPDALSGQGTSLSPFVVERFPFVHEYNTTLGQSSQIQFFSCAPTTGEEGPEVVYELRIPADGSLTVEVSDSATVDVDIQLLSSLAVTGGVATGCLVRNDARFSFEVKKGTYYLVADSYSKSGTSYQGPYRLAIELQLLDVWQSVTVRQGVTWKKKVYASLNGERQTVNVLEIDLSQPGLVVKPQHHGGCQRTSDNAKASGALAAINGGFFDTSNCASLDMVKVDGVLISSNHLNGAPQPTLGITKENLPLIEMVAANGDWDAVENALGGYPKLLSAGQIDIQPNLTTSFFTGANPRTAVCVTTSDKLLLVTVDGRTSAGGGMTIPELAQYMLDLGCDDALNLDGGGSTTMWVRDQSLNGIVNYPSDNGVADHNGERKVSDSLQLFAP